MLDPRDWSDEARAAVSGFFGNIVTWLTLMSIVDWNAEQTAGTATLVNLGFIALWLIFKKKPTVTQAASRLGEEAHKQ